MGDYHDLYLKSDVLLLADVYENFRNVCMASYELDPAHYYTAPGLSWDSMLKMTGVTLELIDDVDKYLMIESGLRGGISMISNKYAKANNPYLDDYDPSTPNNYITYLDANNLYGWAMSQYLPTGQFDWMTDKQLEEIDVVEIPDDSKTGYIFEVDLEYPPDIHDAHSDYPLAPQPMIISEDQSSPYTLKLKEELNMKGRPTQKLIPNLYDKKKYVLHYRNLKLYLRLGMKLVKIHRGLEFTQSPWLAEYISHNTEKRKKAKNAFEKDFFKLMNNSCFGKTMENVRSRVNVELVHTPKRLKKVVAKPSFHAFRIFNEDLTAVHLLQSTLTLNKPIYVGLSVLELSKILMYEFHYDYIAPKYGENARLLFTDTDSLCYDIRTDDVYKDWATDIDLFDTSDYSQDHFLFSDKNKKVLGKMKDETAGVPISEFVGLRPKMYSMTYNGLEKKTAKGIGRVAIKNRLKHSLYKKALFDKDIVYASMRQIRSYNHELYSVFVNKVGLCPFDDKRFVLNDGINTRAHGHFLNFLSL